MRKGIAILAALGLALGGCSSTPGPAEETPDYAALVTESYGDCLADLNVVDPLVYLPGENGTKQIGTVTSIAEGLILTFSVVIANTGDTLTVPGDVETVRALETVGC